MDSEIIQRTGTDVSAFSHFVAPSAGRTSLVFFAGPANRGMTPEEPWGGAGYSFGVRQVRDTFSECE